MEKGLILQQIRWSKVSNHITYQTLLYLLRSVKTRLLCVLFQYMPQKQITVTKGLKSFVRMNQKPLDIQGLRIYKSSWGIGILKLKILRFIPLFDHLNLARSTKCIKDLQNGPRNAISSPQILGIQTFKEEKGYGLVHETTHTAKLAVFIFSYL